MHMVSKEEMRANIASIEERIAQACERAGRPRDSVTLIAVSKMNPPEAVIMAHELGLGIFGENKVQEMCMKQDIIRDPLEWHLIGHLQTNKVHQVVGRTRLIHSVDSLKLARTIDRISKEKGLVSDILIEVNIGGEESKFGVTPDECDGLVREISMLSNVHVCGLMTVAPPVSEPSEARPYFRKMRDLLVDINNKNYDNIYMNVLSMGMTGDFETAIEEGATHIRIGTALFGARDYGQH